MHLFIILAPYSMHSMVYLFYKMTSFFQAYLPPEECSSTLSSLFFSWLDPLVWSGFRSPLTKDRVPKIKEEMEAKRIMAEFQKHLDLNAAMRPNTSAANGILRGKDDPEMVALMKNHKEESNGVVVAFSQCTEKAQEKQNILRSMIKAFGVKFFESMVLKVWI